MGKTSEPRSSRPNIDEMGCINIVLNELLADGREWVKVKEVRQLLESKYSLVITVEQLDRRLKNEWKLERRMNPDAEYNIIPRTGCLC